MASDPLSRKAEIVHVDPSERLAAPAAGDAAGAKQRARSAAIVVGTAAAHFCLVLVLDRLDMARAVIAQKQQEIPIELVTEPPPDDKKKASETSKKPVAGPAEAQPAKPQSLAAKAEAKPEQKLEAKPQTAPEAKPEPKQEAKREPTPQPKPSAEPSPKAAAKAQEKPQEKPQPKPPAEPPKPPSSSEKATAESKPAAPKPAAPKPAEEKKPPASVPKAAESKPADPKPPPTPPAPPKLPQFAGLPTGLDPPMDKPVSQGGEQPAQQAGLPPIGPRLPPMSETFRAVAVPSPTQDGDLIMAYKTLVFSKLELAKQFPAEARKRHAHGSAIIAFALDDQGHVKRVTLVESSGDTALDVASLALVERAAPFPPPPPGAQKEFAAVVEFDDGE